MNNPKASEKIRFLVQFWRENLGPYAVGESRPFSTLSAARRSRAQIARRNPRIWILDTSNYSKL